MTPASGHARRADPFMTPLFGSLVRQVAVEREKGPWSLAAKRKLGFSSAVAFADVAFGRGDEGTIE
eukprot:480608-Prymnesium_polylepis.2